MIHFSFNEKWDYMGISFILKIGCLLLIRLVVSSFLDLVWNFSQNHLRIYSFCIFLNYVSQITVLPLWELEFSFNITLKLCWGRLQAIYINPKLQLLTCVSEVTADPETKAVLNCNHAWKLELMSWAQRMTILARLRSMGGFILSFLSMTGP